MSVLDEFREEAIRTNTRVQKPIEGHLEALMNRLFYLEKDIEEETKFIKHIMTRGAETQERVGLHASSIIEYPSKYCVKKQVLSLIYKQDQGEQIAPGLKRIFEEGNAIHEKWQRLFIRGGWSKYDDLDKTVYVDEYQLQFTPDAICTIEGERYVCEIKSMNTFSFKKQLTHTSGKKQLMLYMYLTGIHKGFVLMEDKNTQEFRVKYYELDMSIVEPFIERLEEIKSKFDLHSENNYANIDNISRHEKCENSACVFADSCAMRDACYNIGRGKRLINQSAHLEELTDEERLAWEAFDNATDNGRGNIDGISVWNM